MSATADATQLAIERALDHANVKDHDDREAFAARFYRGDATEFEQAAVQTEFAKLTRADIGRPDFTDTHEQVLGAVAGKILQRWRDNPCGSRTRPGDERDQT